MKMQKSVIFVNRFEKKLKLIMWKIKDIQKLAIQLN